MRDELRAGTLLMQLALLKLRCDIHRGLEGGRRRDRVILITHTKNACLCLRLLAFGFKEGQIAAGRSQRARALILVGVIVLGGADLLKT